MFLRNSRLLLAASVVSAAFLSTAVFADEPAAKGKDDPERMVCKRAVPTGSIMIKKVCHTAAEWAEMRRNAPTSVKNRDAMDQTTRVPTSGI